MAEFIEVIVEEIISDPSLYTPDKMREMVPKIINKRFFCDEPPQDDAEEEIKHEDKIYRLRAPRNSILAHIKSGAKAFNRKENDEADPGDRQPYLTVFYPFFSSHFLMPVKPTESVWAFTQGSEGFWISRVHCPLHVEDVNLTHRDRTNLPVKQTPVITPEENEKAKDPANTVDRVPNFQDGNSFDARTSDVRDKDEETILTLDLGKQTFAHSQDSTGNSHYEHIRENSLESDRCVFEPVPAFTSRPGDLVLQGSNNTSIVLGLERGYSKVDTRPDKEKSNSAFPEEGLTDRSGAIDIVAGRGRIPPSVAIDDVVDADPEEGTTRARVIKNIREELETDKNIGLDEGKAPDGGNLIDAPEGDPDFNFDASRIYVSMKSSPDDLLGLEYPQIPTASDAGNVGADILPVVDRASVILKSDEIRIVARQEPDGSKGENDEINGSIKIVKEGVADSREGDGRAVVIIQPDGTIMIDGPKIVIGSGAKVSEDDHGGGSQISLGLGAEEPIVLGNELIGILSAIVDVLDGHVHPSAAGPTGPRAGGTEQTPIGGFQNTSDVLTDLKCILSKIGKTL